jgi:hypothetical protein
MRGAGVPQLQAAAETGFYFPHAAGDVRLQEILELLLDVVRQADRLGVEQTLLRRPNSDPEADDLLHLRLRIPHRFEAAVGDSLRRHDET